MGLRQWLERRRVRKAFRNFVGPELLAKLKEIDKARESQPVTLEPKHFQFVVAHVVDTKLEEIPDTAGKVIGAMLQGGAIVSNRTSSLLVGLMGVPFPRDDSPDLRSKLVAALLAENGERIRIAHGHCTGLWGWIGVKGRYTFGEVIPNFSGILKKLLECQFGTAIEIS